MIACPQSRGHVINFSRKLFVFLIKLKQDSKGCNKKEKKKSRMGQNTAASMK